MTKEQFLRKWGWLVLQDEKEILSDLEAVIATEVAKVKEPQPELNPIAEAYERGEKIRKKHWASEDWIKKISDTESIDENGKIWITSNDFKSIKTMPDNWELYTEPTEQPAPFDKERFERMFRAVIETHEATMNALKQLDAYYATKKGGENGI